MINDHTILQLLIDFKKYFKVSVIQKKNKSLLLLSKTLQKSTLSILKAYMHCSRISHICRYLCEKVERKEI